MGEWEKGDRKKGRGLVPVPRDCFGGTLLVPSYLTRSRLAMLYTPCSFYLRSLSKATTLTYDQPRNQQHCEAKPKRLTTKVK